MVYLGFRFLVRLVYVVLGGCGIIVVLLGGGLDLLVSCVFRSLVFLGHWCFLVSGVFGLWCSWVSGAKRVSGAVISLSLSLSPSRPFISSQTDGICSSKQWWTPLRWWANPAAPRVLHQIRSSDRAVRENSNNNNNNNNHTSLSP